MRFDLNLMSLIQIPLLPASSMMEYTTFSSLSAPLTLVFFEGSFNLYKNKNEVSQNSIFKANYLPVNEDAVLIKQIKESLL